MGYNVDEDWEYVDNSGYLIGILFVAIISGLTGCSIGTAIGILLF
jgi:hypothetical protein